MRPQAEYLYLFIYFFRQYENPMKQEDRGFEITSPSDLQFILFCIHTFSPIRGFWLAPTFVPEVYQPTSKQEIEKGQVLSLLKWVTQTLYIQNDGVW